MRSRSGSGTTPNSFVAGKVTNFNVWMILTNNGEDGFLTSITFTILTAQFEFIRILPRDVSYNLIMFLLITSIINITSIAINITSIAINITYVINKLLQFITIYNFCYYLYNFNCYLYKFCL